jgi:Fur family ferric uptake transcriptional regulator
MGKNNKEIQDLKNRGLKNTKHRVEILRFLQQSDQPNSAEQIFLALQKKDIAINFSTVYRTLELLVSKDLAIKQTVMGSSSALYEYNKMVHSHYLICMNCKRIEVIECCPLGDYERTLEKQTDFIIAGHKLDIYGYCPKCKELYIGGEL